MAQPYVGEIRMFAGNFPPSGWMFCDGQTLPISENETLFQLIGTTYGGDGQSTFNLPNLQSRVPIHQGTGAFGNSYQLAQNGGVETVTLSINQIPNHTHQISAGTTGNVASGNGAILADGASAQGGVRIYSNLASTVTMNAGTIQSAGGSQPHENLQPYLAINFIISLFGIFPSQT